MHSNYVALYQFSPHFCWLSDSHNWRVHPWAALVTFMNCFCVTGSIAIMVLHPFVNCFNNKDSECCYGPPDIHSLLRGFPYCLDPWHSCMWSRSMPCHISVSEACSCTTLYIVCLWMNSTPPSINPSASHCMGVCGPPGKMSKVVNNLKGSSPTVVWVWAVAFLAKCSTLGLICRKNFW